MTVEASAISSLINTGRVTGDRLYATTTDPNTAAMALASGIAAAAEEHAETEGLDPEYAAELLENLARHLQLQAWRIKN